MPRSEASGTASAAPVPTRAGRSLRLTTVRTAVGPVQLAQEGRGPTVLALHGGMGGYDQGLLLAHAALDDAGAFDVLAPSRPGYLGTPLDGRGSTEAQADLYAALLDAMGRERTLVMAVSAGGPGALAFAARHPDRCAGLVLVSACTVRLKVPRRVAQRLPVMHVASRVPGLAALMGWMAAHRPQQAARASIRDAEICRRTLAHPQAGPLMRALQESVFRDMARRLPGTAGDVAHLSALPETVAPVRVPVLAIHGTGDRVVPFHHAERLAQAMPEAELMTITEGEHVALFTHLDAVRARVADFLARQQVG